MDGSLHAALTCAALLMDYHGPLPEIEVEHRAVTQAECDTAIANGGEVEWFHEHYGPQPICFALTYYLSQDAGSFKKGWTKVVMPSEAPFDIQVTEALRVLNFHNGRALSSAEIYNLRDRAGDCKADPAAGPPQVAGG